MSDNLTPRERVAALIEDAAGKNLSGEQILQLIEKRTLGYDKAAQKVVFFHTS